jgi:Fe2+ transport system protein B
MISIVNIPIVVHTFLIKDNVVLAGLIQELLVSVIDSVKTELMLDRTIQLLSSNIPQILLLNVPPLVETEEDATEVI